MEAEAWLGVAMSDMDLQKVLPIILALLAVVVVGVLGRFAINRYRRSLTKDPQGGGSWTLDDLRQMKDSGQLTEAEYQVLRQRMARKTMDSMAGRRGKPNPPGESDDKISR